MTILPKTENNKTNPSSAAESTQPELVETGWMVEQEKQDDSKKSSGDQEKKQDDTKKSDGENTKQQDNESKKSHDETEKHDDKEKKHDNDSDHGKKSDGRDAEHGHDKKSDKPKTMGEELTKGMEKYLDTGHLFEHVQDTDYIETPKFLGLRFTDSHGHPKSGFKLPNPLGTSREEPLIKVGEKSIFNVVGKPTKFMGLEFLGAIILVVIFVGLARRVQGGKPVQGRFWNLIETFVKFVRDDIARPAIGKKDADRFLPFLLTTFFFILVLNLLGMIPMFGSATGAISVTAVLAVATFIVVVGSGMQKMGVIGFLKAQIPSMDLPTAIAIFLLPLIFVIEIFGLLVKHFVLAVRLFANMFAGHLVLVVLVSFVGVTYTTWLVYAVGPLAVVGTVAFSMLELFVAFLQAYVFTFLAALFIGSAQHAH